MIAASQVDDVRTLSRSLFLMNKVQINFKKCLMR